LWQTMGSSMTSNKPHPLEHTSTCMFWTPIEPGSQMQMSDDYTITFAEGQHLPVFLSGEEMDSFRETNKISFTPHTILMGALLGYSNMVGVPDHDLEREFLADTIRNLALKAFKDDNLGKFLLKAAHWLRSEVGLSRGRTASQTSMQLAPFNMAIRTDYISMTWYQAEDEQDETLRLHLLEEIVDTYQKFSMEELPEFFLGRTSYFFCAALGMLGRHTLPEEREWYDHAFRYIDHPVPLEKLEQCQRDGYPHF